MICPHCAFPNQPGAGVCAKCRRSLAEPASDETPASGGWMAPPISRPPPGPPPLPRRAPVDSLAAARSALAEAARLEADGQLRAAFLGCQAILIDQGHQLPDDLLAEVHLRMGRISIAQDKPERARKYLERAAALNPDTAGLDEIRGRLEPAERAAASLDQPAELEELTGPEEPDELEELAGPEEPDELAGPEEPDERAGPIEQPAGTAPRSGPQGRLAWAATFWARVAAVAIDGLLVGGLVAVMALLAGLLLGLDGPAIAETITAGVPNLLAVGVLSLGLLLVYLTAFARLGGQTVGKMLLGLRVVRLDGHSLTTTDALRRMLGLLLAGLPGLGGLIWAAFDLNRRGWHDRIGGTLVVRVRPPRRAGEAAAASEA